jgi:hypothetical protein
MGREPPTLPWTLGISESTTRIGIGDHRLSFSSVLETGIEHRRRSGKNSPEGNCAQLGITRLDDLIFRHAGYAIRRGQVRRR